MNNISEAFQFIYIRDVICDILFSNLSHCIAYPVPFRFFAFHCSCNLHCCSE